MTKLRGVPYPTSRRGIYQQDESDKVKVLADGREQEGEQLKHCEYRSYDDLPLTLSVMEVAGLLSVSRSSAYELVQTPGFPVVRIGSRMIVPRDKLIAWIDEKSSGDRE